MQTPSHGREAGLIGGIIVYERGPSQKDVTTDYADPGYDNHVSLHLITGRSPRRLAPRDGVLYWNHRAQHDKMVSFWILARFLRQVPPYILTFVKGISFFIRRTQACGLRPFARMDWTRFVSFGKNRYNLG